MPHLAKGYIHLGAQTNMNMAVGQMLKTESATEGDALGYDENGRWPIESSATNLRELGVNGDEASAASAERTTWLAGGADVGVAKSTSTKFY